MTKILKLEGLDCANCAAKIERNVSKIKGIVDSNVNFMTCKLLVELEKEDSEVMNLIEKAVKKVDSNIVIKG